MTMESYIPATREMTPDQRIDPELSPLGTLGPLYLEKDPSKGAILLNPKDQTIELYPTGFTRTSLQHPNLNRQFFFEELYKYAVSQGTENKEFPIPTKHHDIHLEQGEIQTSSGLLSHNALRIVLVKSPGVISNLPDRFDLGHVPHSITEAITINLHMINPGKIFKIRKKVFGKYFGTKLIFPYGTNTLTPNSGTMERFTNIILD